VLRGLAVALVLAAGVVCAVALLRAPAGVVATTAAAGAQPMPAAPAGPPKTPPAARTVALESMFQDDRELIYSPTATVVRTLGTLRSLGVQRLRLTILWSAIAPSPDALAPPAGFDGGDPAAYAAAAWAPYDRIVTLARARGIAVDFDLTAPGPRWAMASGAPLATEANHYAPSAAAFGRFALAVGRRYSGRYRPAGAAAPLPRVGFWSIWNEPNQPGWLAPQTLTGPGTAATITSARLYRAYVDAAFAALRRSGHGGDAILIGELAPEGDTRPGPSRAVPPLPFLRALYCVDAAYAPLTGAAARALACPVAGSRSAFVSAHPGLFAATAFAHHPYSFFLAPSASMTDVNFAPLADLGRLEQALDHVFAAYRVSRRLPIYLTEYGYETNPPNPYRGVAPATQAAYLDQAAFLAWRDPRVRGLSQFLLRDSPPDTAYPRASVKYWSTFQTGLEYQDGAPKPAYNDYRVAIALPSPSTVWGWVRAAPPGVAARVAIQWRPPGGRWRTLKTVTARAPGHVLTATVHWPAAGQARLDWSGPDRRTRVSRAVAVSG
jgi:hypothetical protein